MTDERYLKRTILKETMKSRFLPEGERQLRIYLPPGYNEVLSYPVVYCQDGEDFFNFGRIATIANQIILDEGVEPFIIVGVEVNKKVRTSEYAPDGNRHEAYVRFFGEELIPYIEERFPARREPENRLLAGDSLGGSVSFHLALAYPHLFTRVLSMSGAFFERSLEMMSEPRDLSWLQMYMIVGLQETAYQTTDRGVYNFVELNRTAKSLLENNRAQIHYEEKDGQHQWGFWQKELPAALLYFMPRA